MITEEAHISKEYFPTWFYRMIDKERTSHKSDYKMRYLGRSCLEVIIYFKYRVNKCCVYYGYRTMYSVFFWLTLIGWFRIIWKKSISKNTVTLTVHLNGWKAFFFATANIFLMKKTKQNKTKTKTTTTTKQNKTKQIKKADTKVVLVLLQTLFYYSNRNEHCACPYRSVKLPYFLRHYFNRANLRC